MRPRLWIALSTVACGPSCLWGVGGECSAAPSVIPAVTEQHADSLFQHQDWPAAAGAYRALTGSEPTNGRYWYRLGVAQYGLQRYHEAVEAWTRSEAIGHNPVVMYNLGVGYALLDDKDQAFEWLGKAVTAGFRQETQLQGDADLTVLRTDPRYPDLVVRVHAANAPCEGRLESHQFDFWIGDWEVKTQQGSVAGHSHIEQILGQCVILENWIGSQGGAGRSFNSYDAANSTWRQVWVDDRGGVTEFTDGVYTDAAMRFRTQSKAADGSEILGRLSFHNLGPDKVRQWKERSVDAGKTWTTDYDFIYERQH